MNDEKETTGPRAAAAADSTRTNIPFMRQRRLARHRAVQFIYALDLRKDWNLTDEDKELFDAMTSELDEDSDDLPNKSLAKAKKYAMQLLEGVVAHREEIDALIVASASNWSLRRIGMVDRNILRMAAYEMKYEDAVPVKTSMDEAIELAKEFGQADSARFVNGVIEQVYRRIKATEQQSVKKD